MKLIITLSIFGIIVGVANCAPTNKTAPNKPTEKIQAGHLTIFADKHGMHCGTLLCPVGSRCVITKKTHGKDFFTLHTKQKCFDDEDNLVKSTIKSRKLKKEHGRINKRWEVSSNGVKMVDPERAREIARNVEKSIQDVQKSLRAAFNTPFFNNAVLPVEPVFGTPFPMDHNSFPMPTMPEEQQNPFAFPSDPNPMFGF